jgi:hypothetical protein
MLNNSRDSNNSNRKGAAVHARRSASKFSSSVVRSSHVHVKKYHAATPAGKAFVAGSFHIGIPFESTTHKKGGRRLPMHGAPADSVVCRTR